ncbi:MAG: hypothetical protein IJ572_01405 [Bacilli bacterium]|nr:hypothetical protein [Bacilli bacterium]
MEKIKISSINIVLIIIVIALLLVPATIYILKSHYDAMNLVIEKKVIEKASECYNSKKCKSKIIKLQELIDKKYIEKIYDPISKELINLESYVDLENNEFKIVK